LKDKEFIYKKTAKFGLANFKKQLEEQYKHRFAEGELIIMSSNDPGKLASLDTTKSYIQMTGVQPYFESDEQEDRLTRWEQHFNIST